MQSGVLDTSIIIEILDKANHSLLEHLLNRYEIVYIPWITMYEYLYGHKYLNKPIGVRKKALEELGIIIWMNQEILAKALELDINLHRRGKPIPFSDILIAAIVFYLNAELATLDVRHFKDIPGIKVYIPRSFIHSAPS